MKSTHILTATVLLTFLSAACNDSSKTASDVTGEWHAARTVNDVIVEQTEFVLELSPDFTYHMESEISRKVEDYDYYAKIAGSEREYDGKWELSDDGKTIVFLMPKLEGDERQSNYDGMELTVSDDGETLTRSDINADMSLLVFTRD